MQIQIWRLRESAFLTNSQMVSLLHGPRFEEQECIPHLQSCGKIQILKFKTSDAFASWGIRKYLNHMKRPVEPQSCKHLISFPVRLTWKEYIHEHVGFESSRLGTRVQTWSWKFCPHNFPHCNACIHLHRIEKEEKKDEKRKWMNHKSVNLEMSQIPPATYSFVLSNNRLGTKLAVKTLLIQSKMLFPLQMVKSVYFGQYPLL